MLRQIGGPFEIVFKGVARHLLNSVAWDDRIGLICWALRGTFGVDVYFGAAQIDGYFGAKNLAAGAAPGTVSWDFVRGMPLLNLGSGLHYSFDGVGGFAKDLIFDGYPPFPARVLDRYISFGANTAVATPADGPYDGEHSYVEATFSTPFPSTITSMGVGKNGGILVGNANGSLYVYSPVEKRLVGAPRSINEPCSAIFYSQKCRAFVSVHNPVSIYDPSSIKLWSEDTIPDSVSVPSSDGLFQTGRKTRVHVTVLGNLGEPVDNQPVKWESSSAGTFTNNVTITDENGVAETYFTPSGTASTITITATTID